MGNSILERENLVLAACLQEPGLIRRISLELAEDRFTEGLTRAIYKAMVDTHLAGKSMDIFTVSASVDAGAYPQADGYLKSLLDYLPRMGIVDLRGVDDWVRFVDNAGRLRQASLVVKEYCVYFEDLQKVVLEVGDADQFLNDIIKKFKVAQGNPKQGYQHVSTAIEKFEQRVEKNMLGVQTDRFSTGWQSFDKALAGGMPNGFTVLCGIAGTGKTQLALQLAERIASRVRPGCVAVNSFEMQDWKLVMRLACSSGGIDSRDILGGTLSEADSLRLKKETDRIKGLPIYIDPSDIATTTVIDLQASALQAEHGPINLLIIDYAELVKENPDDNRTDSQEVRISKVFTGAKSISKELNIPVILLSQYSRKIDLRPDKVGTDSDIRYAGVAEHVADNIFHIYNPWQLAARHIPCTPPKELTPPVGKAYVIVSKDRDAGSSEFLLGWNAKYTQWSDGDDIVQLGALAKPKPDLDFD